jgi:hypothetical protein
MAAFPLKADQQVTASTIEFAPLDQDISGYFSPEEWTQAAQDAVTLHEVRLALATISGSLSEAVIAQRDER